ncbi:MAG: 2-amino-4-hydroxy-6-hydroxymethyldihydropteridine diphosphokinase [Chloroflexota bacterium]|nr:2-amino-4-hydroxy-6-hydroxymethyldihydropteridine diphosphokinase [Chloroflexota bacterium]
MNVAYLSLGSNIDKEDNLVDAVDLLAKHGRLLAVSPVYETEAVGNPDDPTFFNAAVMLLTPLSAAQLKETVLRKIEAQLGRRRHDDPNAPRTIDLDISLFNNEVLTLGKRQIPDPEILLYPHVVVPLADVAPDYVHPQTGERLQDIACRVLRNSRQFLIRQEEIDLAPAIWPVLD